MKNTNLIPQRIPLKNEKALSRMRDSGRIVAEVFALLGEHVKPGVSLRELDQLAEAYLRKAGAAPLYKGYKGTPPSHPPFPGVICASVNHEVCHGLPDDRILNEGDIIGVDIGLKKNGYCGDACVTYAIGNITADTQQLLDVAHACLWQGISAAQPGQYLNAIGIAVETYARQHGMSVVKEWGGHGVGKTLHEPPSVSHVIDRQRGPKMRPGMVFTIEPMINRGQPEWELLDDGWTVVTKDGALSAQFEHTVAITREGPEILTTLES